MIDITKLKYKLILITEKGEQIDITEVTRELGWEEGHGELAMRIGASIHNKEHKGTPLSSLAKLGCMVAVIADWGDNKEEVARGRIEEWDPRSSGRESSLDILAYDELFNLQQSQDNRYYSAGTGTKSAINSIFKDWGIPLGKYEGPDVSHAKTLFKNDYLGDIIADLLDDAEKKGGPECIIRANKGKVDVLRKGSNKDIYHFNEDSNLVLSNDKMSTVNLVTRVKIVGKEDKDGRQKAEATLDGLTEHGIRQRIQVRQEDDSLSTAKSTAQKLLDEEGKPERTITLQAPDVPTIRKGDKIHVKAGTLDGYFIVKAVRHDATSKLMNLEIEPEKEEKPKTAEKKAADSGSFEKGDNVILNGAVYRDSYGKGKGRTFSNHKGKITIKVDTKRPCPYHVDHIGWVYPNTISKA